MHKRKKWVQLKSGSIMFGKREKKKKLLMKFKGKILLIFSAKEAKINVCILLRIILTPHKVFERKKFPMLKVGVALFSKGALVLV